MSIKDINELKILLFQDRLTNYGKREMINYYENEIARQKQINEEHQKEIAELKEYIFIAPNLDEMTATKYANIQREAYTKGRAEEQQRAEYIIYKNFIPKQVVKDKIEEYFEDEEWLIEHDLKALCDDEKECREYYINKKIALKDIKKNILDKLNKLLNNY